MSTSTPNTAQLLWDNNRLGYLLGVGVAIAVFALLVSKFYAPEYQNWIAAGFIVGVVVTIGFYYIHFWTGAIGPQHIAMRIIGTNREVDVFYLKGTEKRESKPIEGFCINPECDYEWQVPMPYSELCPKCDTMMYFSRFETQIYCTETYHFPELFGEDSLPSYHLFFRHWGAWGDRVATGWGIAVKGGIPYGHSHSEFLFVKALDVGAFIGPEGFNIYPTFEIWGTARGDAERDFEPFNDAFRAQIKKSVKGAVRAPKKEETVQVQKADQR